MIFEGRCHGGGGDKSHEPTAECVAYNCLPTKLLPSWIIQGLYSQERGQSAREGGVGVGGPEVDKDSAGDLEVHSTRQPGPTGFRSRLPTRLLIPG